jgi:GNAT superfamily N-acetyltransferase
MGFRYEWRGDFDNAEVNALHAEGFDHKVLDDDWKTQLHEHSLGWVCARDADRLVGFVNVAWDGAVHAFVVDALVTAHTRRQGVGTQLIAVAEAESRAAGCEWLHVDFHEDLRSFYLDACGFRPTNAGLIAL